MREGQSGCGYAAPMRALPVALFTAVSLFVFPALADDAGSDETGADAPATTPTCSADGASSIAKDGTAVSCAPYRCTPSSGLCAMGCAAVADCTAGFQCTGGMCVRQGAVCSADGTSVTSPDGTTVKCSPYRCGTDGSCRSRCTTDSDCATDFVCETGAGQCRVKGFTNDSAPNQGEGNSCAYGASGTTAFGLVLGTLALVAAGRRRR